VYENNETEIPGIFSAGNVLHVHDLVDFVTAEGLRAGRAAALFDENQQAMPFIEVAAGEGVAYTVPQRVRTANVDKALEILFRVNGPFAQGNVEVALDGSDEIAHTFKREHMIPAEMERIRVPKATLEKAARLIIRVRGVGQHG